MKNSTTPARQLDLQGLAGFVSVSLCCFLGYGFWMTWEWIFNDLGMDLGTMGPFRVPKSIKK